MMPIARYRDRVEAGEVLAGYLGDAKPRPDAIVLALPRGGVPVGVEVARALQVPFDILVVRKLGVPGHPELAMGAIASGGVRVLNEEVVRQLRITAAGIATVAAEEQAELERRERVFRGARPRPALTGRVVVLVDDGLATGATMRAAAVALRRLGAGQVIATVPVGAAESCERLSLEVDRLICPLRPNRFRAVGEWYENFAQTSDAEVRRLIEEAARRHDHHSPASIDSIRIVSAAPR
jgi:putative phosphoribosyl transferase